MKQETLEEAAEKAFKTKDFCGLDINPFALGYFIAGVKWYNEERSYSEEDMDNYAEYCTTHVLTSKTGHPYLSVKKWFEQFKKK